MDKLLKNKNLLITGAARNIGRSIALEAGACGATVYFTDINQKNINILENELRKKGITAHGFLSDISLKKDTDKFWRELQKKKTHIDVLINNVGIGIPEKPREFNWNNCQKIFNTNVIGPNYLTHLVSEDMIKNKKSGNIIFITSIHQEVIRRYPNYSASKAALVMYIKELALELARFKIRVNGVAPGYTMEDENGNPLPHQFTPLQSSINPNYIAKGVVFLASDYFSKFTTGEIIKIDAGLSLHNHLCQEIPAT